VASIAWHLSVVTVERFWLPRHQLAALLKTRANTICDVVTLLERDGLIRCVDPDYSFTKGKAKEYLFTGPPPAVARDAA
jgi:hypothetical protein